MGSRARMEMNKFGRNYGQLMEVMLEHARMEERVVFPILDKADRGLSKAANEEHARDLPIMNGIKEDIKSIGVLDLGSPVYQEALFNLANRFKMLKNNCQHFEEEEGITTIYGSSRHRKSAAGKITGTVSGSYA
nr:uncharacterized protein LOC113723811 [Coffea arabica]